MAADKLTVYNLALVRLGENRLELITDESEPRRKLDAIYDNILEQVTVAGPLKGWKFAKIKLPVSVDSTSITAFADYSGTEAGTVLVTAASHNLVTGDLVLINGSEHYDNEYQVTVVNTDNFYITATFVPDELTTADIAIIESYDANLNDIIDLGEVVSAINDNTAGTLSDRLLTIITDLWSAATLISSLSPVAPSGTPLAYWTSADYAYRYAIPSAAKRVVKASVLGIELSDWITRGEWVLTNLEDDKIWIEYVQLITDTTLFPAHFTKVLYMSLAVELSYNLIQSSTHSERLLIELQDKILPKAIALDEQEKQVTESSTAWVDAGR